MKKVTNKFGIVNLNTYIYDTTIYHNKKNKMKYVAIGKTKIEIEAEQFNPPYQIPKGVINVYQMGKGTKQDPTWYTGEMWTPQGEKVRVKVGEWIVQESDVEDTYYSISDDVFKRKYKPLK